MRRPRILLLGTALAAAACKKSPVPLEGIELVAAGIDTTETLGAWLAHHPADSVTAETPSGLPTENVCRVSARTLMVAGEQARRFAVFFVPPIPAGEALPTDTIRLAERFCHLREIWLQHDEPDSSRAAAFADSVGRAAERILGAAKPGVAFDANGAARWLEPRRWVCGATRLGLGIAGAERSRDDETRHVTNQPNHVMLAAIAPDTADTEEERYRMEVTAVNGQDPTALERLQATALDSAVAMVDIPTIRTSLESVVRQMRDSAPPGYSTNQYHTAAFDSLLARAYRASADSMSSLDARRRAGLFLGNGFVLTTYAGSLGDALYSAADSSFQRLTPAGVSFENSYPGGESVSVRPWLWAAYRADSLGPAGKLAFRTLLASGWTTRPACADSGIAYQRVIEHGEAAIAAGHTDPMIHYLVAWRTRTLSPWRKTVCPNMSTPSHSRRVPTTSAVWLLRIFRPRWKASGTDSSDDSPGGSRCA